MINEQTQPFHSYLLTVVKGKWIDWTVNYLSQSVPDEKKGLGFQELTGSEGADVRTRELEFYRLGFLKKRLIRDRATHGNEVPDGWQMLLNNEMPLSPEGTLAAILGEALNSPLDSLSESRFENALKLLGLISTFAWGIERNHKVVSPLLVFQYVLDIAMTSAKGKSLTHLDRISIQRWVSQAVNNTLDSAQHASDLVDDYINSSDHPRLVLQWQDPPASGSLQSTQITKVTTAALVDEATDSVGKLPPLNVLLRHKGSLYWGAEDGLYGTTAWNHHHLLSLMCKVDQERMSAGNVGLMQSLIVGDRLSDSLIVDVSVVLNHHECLEQEWRSIVKTIYEASLEALAKIRPWSNSERSIFFPRGVMQESLADSTLRIPEAQVPLVPRPDDRISHNDEEYVVVSVTRERGDLLIKVR